MDAHDKLERAAEEIFRLSEAIEYLSGVRDCGDVIQILRDRMIVLNFEYEQLHAAIEAKDDMERREIVFEFERSVI